MGQDLHGSARMTAAVRVRVQRSQASLNELSERFDLNPKTVAKWKKRQHVQDAPMGPKQPSSTVLTTKEATIVAVRKVGSLRLPMSMKFRRLSALSKCLEDKTIAGDKAYIGIAEIIKPARKNMEEQDPSWNKALARTRKRIETSFSTLVRSSPLHAAQVMTFWLLRAKVNLKIAAHNLIHSGLLNG